MAGIRFSIEELQKKGLITEERAKVLRQEMSQSPMSKLKGPSRKKSLELVDGKMISRPHRLVWEALSGRWPGRAILEHAPLEERRIRLDVAFPNEMYPLAVEVDGFTHHGKFLSDFKKDRRRQNLLCLAGWRILRFFPEEIYHDIDGVVSQVAEALAYKPEIPSK